MPANRMAAADAAWLGMDAPHNRMIVTGVLRLQGPADWARFTQVVQERMVARYPAFRRCAVPGRWPFAWPRWRDDPHFDLSDHLVPAELATDSESGLADLVSEVLGTPLDMTRAPWRFHLVDGPQGDSTIVARLHHCIADGVALGAVLLSLTDDLAPPESAQPPTTKPAQPESVGPRPGPLRRVLRLARFGLGLVTTGTRILLTPRDPRTRLQARPGPQKRVAWTRPIELDRLKAISRAHGVTLNDVLLAVTAGALRRHLRHHGEPPRDLRIFMPVNLRPPGQPVLETLGNRFGLVFLSLPISVADAEQRVRAVHARTRRLKAGQQAAVTFALLTIVGLLPVWAQGRAARLIGATSTAVITNVPGPRQPVHLAGVPLARVMFWVPQPGSVGLGVSILSYAGAVTIGLAADRQVLADPSELADAVEAEVVELEKGLG